MSRTVIYLAPGMFGFAKLAAYDYFGHLERALLQRFEAKGRELAIWVAELHPTASIRRRAGHLVDLIQRTSGSAGPIHILGHSTGGLDARLVASPSVHIAARADSKLDWIERLRSVTTVNTPHYGTPLASFFATAKGQQMLYAVSAITVIALKLGAPPLSAVSALVAALGRGGEALELALVDRVTEAMVRVLDEAASRHLREWLRQVRDDQGGVVQLMPEAMDLFRAGVVDRPTVHYQCVASYAPTAGVADLFRVLGSPWSAVSATLFGFLARITAQQDSRYPCAPRDGGAPTLRRMLGQLPPPGASDGVVPLSSQLWGEAAWIGQGDHLDVVGHFSGPPRHNDWLSSGARFDRLRFDSMVDRVFAGMLKSEQRPAGSD